MKIAIVCDWLVTIGGAEKFLSVLLNCFPTADLFAVVDFLDTQQRKEIGNKTAKTTFIQGLPLAKRFYRHYLPLMPLAIEQLDLTQYDLILSSSHAVAKGILTGPDQLHISYVHSPMRYAWDLQHQYLKESGLNQKWRGLVARYFLHKMRLWDLRSAKGVDHFIANSHFIARRIQKTYRVTANVIYPPVNTTQFSPHERKENFYLTASRLVPYKRIDLIVDSFNTMPDKKLIVIGDGPDAQKIKRKAGPNIELLGFTSTSTLIDYMQRAKAFVFAAEEDFGMLPVEAQAAGTPVIALNKGGTKETVRGLDQQVCTGVLFAEQTISHICAAVKLFETNHHRFSVINCVTNAQRFDTQQFSDRIQAFVKEKYNQFHVERTF